MALQDVGKFAEDIYSKQLQITVKNLDLEERKSKLTVTAQLQSTSPSLFRKDFVVRLTDEVDPLFYYYLRLTDEDYQSLRTQQGLLVDFLSFPQKFVDLLDLCYREETKASPRFVLQMQICNGNGALNIVEVNPFKHLVHLSLKLVPGSDAEVKRYLADTVKQLKQKNEQLNTSLKSTETELSQRLRESSENLLSSSAEIERLKVELKDQVALLHDRFGHQLNNEKDRLIQIQSELQEKYERERRELEYSRSKAVGTLEVNIIELETEIRDLKENKYRCEVTINDYKNRMSTLEDEVKVARHDAQEYRKANVRLEAAKEELERVYGQMSLRLSALELESRESDAVRVKLQAALDAAHEQKGRMEIELDQKNSTLSRREKNLKTLSDEMNKGNEIIRKLQAEIRTIHAKLKLRNKVTQEQEKVVLDKEKQTELLQNQVVTLHQKIEQQEHEIISLKDSLNETQIKAEEAQKALKTNENVINWLNKQLNEAEMNQRRVSTPLASTSTSPLSSSTPIGTGQNQLKPSSYSGSGEALRTPMDAIAEEKEELGANGQLQNNKENKSGGSLNSKYLGPRPTLRGLTGSTHGVTKDKILSSYNARIPKSTLAPLGSNGASSNFPVKFQPSAYFPS